jgi:hypothetical protein
MKNNLTLLAALLILLTIGFGCSFIDKATSGGSNDNTATTTSPGNSSTNSANPNDASKTGVAECDEFLDLLNNDTKKPDEDFMTRKIREYAIDFAKDSIKKNIEENKGDKEKIAKGCREAKADYLKNKEDKNKKEEKDAEKNSNTQKL